ncbi:MAG: FtsX-like permease family protein [Candidatus Spyradocola sp.]|jgi:putative ABC transport system permease protein
MKGLYRRLAWSGVTKNRKFYLPYLLTCTGMTTMYYILAFLANSEILLSFRGGEILRTILVLGCFVMAVFALIFLFYTNSFLIRRRKREFGLYNVLGMGKRHLAGVVIWEALFLAGISLGAGLFLGILLSKTAELGMVRLVATQTDFRMRIEVPAIRETIAVFGILHLLLLLNSLRQIHRTNPLALLQSESAGEKPPKANWVLALLGAVLLGCAYALAVSIEEPISALLWFFVAVILVILGTYLLFIAGSVAACRLLQKNKRYYYKTNHFVSLSSMLYRMKRNGASLASICILCTMVLVMVSSTVCLYIGAEDSLLARYPRSIVLETELGGLDAEETALAKAVQDFVLDTAEQSGQEVSNEIDYRIAGASVYLQGSEADFPGTVPISNRTLWELRIVPLEDYNRITGESAALSDGQALFFTTQNAAYPFDSITLPSATTLEIAGRADRFLPTGNDMANLSPVLYLFVPNFEEVVAPLLSFETDYGVYPMGLTAYFGFDVSGNDPAQIALYNEIESGLESLDLSSASAAFHVDCSCRVEQREGFYSLYGGLFFLGILLGIVFLFAAVLMIYYKQISEGYEDQSRFDIMQRVGMTRREIRKSINSQILTVFFLPLLMAGIHLGFAFPLIYRMLMLFGVWNLRLLILTTGIGYLLFAVLYTAVYRITSGAYYGIVSGAKRT